MDELKTHYDNLQVSRKASSEVIRAAYQRLVQKYHPDKYPHEEKDKAHRITKILTAAYEVLSDPQGRRKHDQWIRKRKRNFIVRNPRQKLILMHAMVAK